MTTPVLIGVIALAVLGVGGLALSLVLGVRWRTMVTSAHRERDEAHVIKNDFVAMVSHELRTPLTSIAGFSETLESAWRDLPTEEVDEFLSIITKQARYLGELVEDVLVIPRLEAGRLRLYFEMVDLSELIHDVASLVKAQSGLETSVAIPGGVKVWGDPKRCQQVVRNLLENAGKYGGKQIVVEGYPTGDHFIVVVSDNGPGVPDEAVNSIFERFEQISKGDARSASGIGLGLPIARRLARAMGGDVWHERRFPTGSRFCFAVTQSAEANERVMAVIEEAEAQNKPAQILR